MVVAGAGFEPAFFLVMSQVSYRCSTPLLRMAPWDAEGISGECQGATLFSPIAVSPLATVAGSQPSLTPGELG